MGFPLLQQRLRRMKAWPTFSARHTPRKRKSGGVRRGRNVRALRGRTIPVGWDLGLSGNGGAATALTRPCLSCGLQARAVRQHHSQPHSQHAPTPPTTHHRPTPHTHPPSHTAAFCLPPCPSLLAICARGARGGAARCGLAKRAGQTHMKRQPGLSPCRPASAHTCERRRERFRQAACCAARPARPGSLRPRSLSSFISFLLYSRVGS